jgi:serine phosphatase RsbU (regulator of sigma subunit)
MIEEVVRSTAEFCGSAEYADDFTVLVLKRLTRA